MASDFTIVQMVRQRFGDANVAVEEPQVEQEAPFVGASKEYVFTCPNILSGAAGVLQFESLGVSTGQGSNPRNVLQINGVDIPGAITPGDGRLWKTHSLIVPDGVLRLHNTLRIEAVRFGIGITAIDNFIIDNIVVFFKARSGQVAGQDAASS